MMGSNKLTDIRRELRVALAATGTDPIQWLEERMRTDESRQSRDEVLQSLRRFLGASGKHQGRKSGAKK